MARRGQAQAAAQARGGVQAKARGEGLRLKWRFRALQLQGEASKKVRSQGAEREGRRGRGGESGAAKARLCAGSPLRLRLGGRRLECQLLLSPPFAQLPRRRRARRFRLAPRLLRCSLALARRRRRRRRLLKARTQPHGLCLARGDLGHQHRLARAPL